MPRQPTASSSKCRAPSRCPRANMPPHYHRRDSMPRQPTASSSQCSPPSNEPPRQRPREHPIQPSEPTAIPRLAAARNSATDVFSDQQQSDPGHGAALQFLVVQLPPSSPCGRLETSIGIHLWSQMMCVFLCVCSCVCSVVQPVRCACVCVSGHDGSPCFTVLLFRLANCVCRVCSCVVLFV